MPQKSKLMPLRANIKKLVIIILVALLSPTASAFHLNPANRKSENRDHKNKFFDLISENVHEQITNKGREIFLRECESSENKKGCAYERKLMNGRVIQDSLLRGVWWNDDPNQDLYKAKQVIWFGHMKDAERRAKKGVRIDAAYMMQYRSHYGDLQFLHSMASMDGKKASDTKEDILMWAEFSYKLSIGEISSGDKFSEVNIDRIHKYFGGRHAEWKINWIFQPKYLLVDTPNDFQEHALGTLIHMVEDSYSEAHVARSYVSTEKCRSGRILSFHSYTKQNPSLHSKADTLAGYNSVKNASESSPELAVAKLISFSHSKASWEREVRPYLDGIVYCFDGDPEGSGPGNY
ncbi:hypothetical protein ACK312_19025 [Aeromonas caviae]